MSYHNGLTRAQGDPGFFGDVFGGIAKIASFIPGPIGAIAGAAAGAFGGGTPAPMPVPISPVTLQQQLPMRVPAPGPIAAMQRFLPGGASGMVECPPGASCPRGFHLNKSAYFLKNGTRVEKGTRCVRNRSRNALNPRALRRANSRQRGFLRAVDSTLKTMPTKAGVSKRRRQISGTK